MRIGFMKVALGLALAIPVVAAPAEERALKIGLAAMISPKETLAYYNDLLAHVGRKLGVRVDMVQYRTYDDMDVALEKRELEIAFICSGPYVKDRERFGAELLVAPQSHGKPFYQAYIIVPASSPARALADLQGKSFAFTDPKSNTGRLAPAYMVSTTQGMPPERFFGSTSFTYSHDRSIDEVGRGAVDGASVESLIYDYLAAKSPARTRGTRILAASPPYGIPPVVVHPKIDLVLKARLKEAFLTMHEDPKGKAILDAIMVDRFVVPNDSDYDTVREMDRWLAKQATPPATVPAAKAPGVPATVPAAKAPGAPATVPAAKAAGTPAIAR